jgi:LmbE family N-acetylglucosaminyl deacetylase
MSDIALIIAAHPDDEVLGCGGTISRLTGEGQAVSIAILGEGITSRYAKPRQADRLLLNRLKKRCREVAELLRARDLYLHDLPDNRFDTVPLLDIVKIVETLVERLQPRTVYTHHPGDLNVDHGITFRAVLTALRPLPGCAARELYSFEVPSSTEWSFHALERRFTPNVFMDIGATLETKLMAMQLYESETRSFPHPRSFDALKATAHRWGSVAGVEAAEAFQLIRSVR